MNGQQTIYILGAGSVGFPLAAYLTNAGRNVAAVRTSRSDVGDDVVDVRVQNGDNQTIARVKTISLANLAHVEGIILIAAKSYANSAIAQALREKRASGPIVLLQNGLGVEKPFLQAQFPALYRCVLYVTAQPAAEHVFVFRPVTTSPIGSVNGSDGELQQVVEALTTPEFPFRTEANIQRETWKKAIINAVFNSICPLLDVDNGIFARSAEVEQLARRVVRECIVLADRLELGLSERELIEQILAISARSDGQLISTLQDIRSGRPTEIDSLNLEIVRVATALQPPITLPNVELLGNLIVAKSLSARSS